MLSVLHAQGSLLEREDLEQDSSSKQEHKAAHQKKTMRASEKGQI